MAIFWISRFAHTCFRSLSVFLFHFVRDLRHPKDRVKCRPYTFNHESCLRELRSVANIYVEVDNSMGHADFEDEADQCWILAVPWLLQPCLVQHKRPLVAITSLTAQLEHLRRCSIEAGQQLALCFLGVTYSATADGKTD